ncbi:MAG: hypothetical protein B6D68_03915, partial [spirochete symbiont of Stewartia floridana]
REVRKPYMAKTSRFCDSPTPLQLPPALAVLVFLILLASGFLDRFFLQADSMDSVVFSGSGSVSIPVHKASLESQYRELGVQQAVFIEHHISQGETLSFISYKYGLSPITLISVNRLQHPDDLKNGSVLIIPYRDGVRERRRNSESLYDAASRLGVETNSVQVLPDGDFFVSGLTYTGELPASFANNMFHYPLVGRVIAPYGAGVDNLTGIDYSSDGIDIAAISGTPVTAARQGKVILTGQHQSYGLYVIIDHQGGWRSFYGHLGRVDVAPGDSLEAGMALGAAGKSGTARTPRLHFVLIRNDQTVDPLNHLY